MRNRESVTCLYGKLCCSSFISACCSSRMSRACSLLLRHRLPSLGAVPAASVRLWSASAEARLRAVESGERGWRVCFFGSDLVARNVLSALYDAAQPGTADVTAAPLIDRTALTAVCRPSSAADRSIVVKPWAHERGIPVLQPASLRGGWTPTGAGAGAGAGSLGDVPFDVAVVASYGALLPRALVQWFPLGGINMHPSLLPKYRGAAPIYHQLLDNERRSGVSIIELHPTTFDAGNILQQRELELEPHWGYLQTAEHLSGLGARMVIDTLRHLRHYQAAAVPQPALPPDAPASVRNASKVSSALCKVDWHAMSASQVLLRFRALGDTLGLYTFWGSRRVKLCELHAVALDQPRSHGSSAVVPGTVTWPGGEHLLIACSDGSFVACRRLQFEGARHTHSAHDFANGHLQRRKRDPSIPAPVIVFGDTTATAPAT